MEDGSGGCGITMRASSASEPQLDCPVPGDRLGATADVEAAAGLLFPVEEEPVEEDVTVDALPLAWRRWRLL